MMHESSVIELEDSQRLSVGGGGMNLQIAYLLTAALGVSASEFQLPPQKEEEERARGNLGPSAKLILPTDRLLISFSRHAEAD